MADRLNFITFYLAPLEIGPTTIDLKEEATGTV